MTERTIDIGQIEGAYAWDDEVWDPDTEAYVPATYSDGTLMKGLRVDSIHLNSDASADSDAVRKSQMTTAMAGYVSKTDFPLDLGTLENGDMLFYNAVDEGWQDLAFLDGSSQILLARIPATLTGKDADTVDGIEGSALLKKDGTVALTGDWDIGSGRKIQAATIEGRNSSNLVLKYGGSDVKLTLSSTGLAFDGGAGDVLNFTTGGGLRLQGAVETGQVKAFDSGGLRLSDDAGGYGVFVKDGGLVGVGHANPDSTLDVAGSASSGKSLRLRSGDATGGSDSSQILMSYNNGVNYTHRIVTNHDSGTAAGNAIDFYLWKYGTDAAATIGTQHVMRLRGNGRVGIGTPDPEWTLEVREATGAQVTAKSTGADSSAALGLVNDARAWVLRVNGTNSDALEIRDATANAQRMTIDSSGKVGVLTTSPTGKLEVEVGGTDAVSALVLDQNDSDQPFITFEGETGEFDERNVFGGEEADLAYSTAVKVKVGSTTLWIKAFAAV